MFTPPLPKVENVFPSSSSSFSAFSAVNAVNAVNAATTVASVSTAATAMSGASMKKETGKETNFFIPTPVSTAPTPISIPVTFAAPIPGMENESVPVEINREKKDALKELVQTLNVDAPVVGVAAKLVLQEMTKESVPSSSTSSSSSSSTSTSSSSTSTSSSSDEVVEGENVKEVAEEKVAEEKITEEKITEEKITEEKEEVVEETFLVSKENENVNLVSDVPFVADPIIPSVFLLQDLEKMTKGEKDLYREQLLSYFKTMQKIDKEEYSTPEISPGSTLEDELTIYQNRMYIYVRKLTIASKQKRYQLYLSYGWGIMELVFLLNGHNMMRGYAELQIKIIGCYDDILMELATIQYSKEERNVVKHVEAEVSPFMQLIKSSMYNTFIIVAFQYFSSFLSPADSKNMISNLVDGVFDVKGKLKSTGTSAIGGVVRGLLSAYVPEQYLGLYDTYVMPYLAGSSVSEKIVDVPFTVEESL
jgi:hypothetical protein